MATKEQKRLQELMTEGHATVNEFTQSLANNPKHLTDKQHFWLIKIVQEAEARRDRALNPKPPTAVIGLAKISELFDVAKEVLKRPTVRLMLGQLRLTLSPSGTKSRNPGAIYIKGEGYPAPYYGKVTAKGEVHIMNGAPEGLKALLTEFAEEPALVAAKYGKITSACSFCGLTLTDNRSVEVGYGSTCAKNWRLPWGE